ncbi:MAG: hypothetical protein Fur0010_11620 [Bdellovibrio sp.]
MNLVISRNGSIKDYSLPTELPLRRVIKSQNKENDFESALAELSPEEKEKEFYRQKMKQANKSYQKSEQQIQSHRHIWLAKQVMTKPVQTLEETTSAHEAKDLMKKFNFHHVPVTRDGKLVGMVSDRDLLPYRDSELRNMRLVQVGPKEVIAARELTDLRTISAIMLSENISALPVLDKNSELIGIITKSDILRLVMKNGPLEIHV